jgi:DNA-binding transcriptional LysR family regulator
LADVPLLHLTTRPKLWAAWFELHEVDGVAAYHGLCFDQFSMIIAAASMGLGIALLPTYLIENELRSGALVALLASSMQTENAYYLVRPETGRTYGVADAFEAWLLSQIGSDPVATRRSEE